MAKLFPEPPRFELPLSLGRDVYLVLERKQPVLDDEDQPVKDTEGNVVYEPVDYEPGTEVVFSIADAGGDYGTSGSEDAPAEIDGSRAPMKMESEIVDPMPSQRLWRIRVSVPGEPDEIVANGVTLRQDGKK